MFSFPVGSLLRFPTATKPPIYTQTLSFLNPSPADTVELRFAGQNRLPGSNLPWPEIPDEMIEALRKKREYQFEDLNTHQRYNVAILGPPESEQPPEGLSRNDWIIWSRIFRSSTHCIDLNQIKQGYQQDVLQPAQDFCPTTENGYEWQDVKRIALRKHLAASIAAIRNNDALKSAWIDFMCRDPNQGIRYLAAQQFATLSTQEKIDAKAEELMMSPDETIKAGCAEKLEEVSPRIRWQLVKEAIDWQATQINQPGRSRHAMFSLAYALKLAIASFFSTNLDLPRWARDRLRDKEVQHLFSACQPDMHRQRPETYQHYLEQIFHRLVNANGYNESELDVTMLAQIRQLANVPKAPAQDLANDVLAMLELYRHQNSIPTLKDGAMAFEDWSQKYLALAEKASTQAGKKSLKTHASQQLAQLNLYRTAKDRSAISRIYAEEQYRQRMRDEGKLIPTQRKCTARQIEVFEAGLLE